MKKIKTTVAIGFSDGTWIKETFEMEIEQDDIDWESAGVLDNEVVREWHHKPGVKRKDVAFVTMLTWEEI